MNDVKKIMKDGVKDHIKIMSDEFGSAEELNEKIRENLFRVEGGKWQCKICKKVSRDLHNAKEHVEVHIEGISFPCQNCDKTLRSRNALRTHKARVCNNGNIISGPGRH